MVRFFVLLLLITGFTLDNAVYAQSYVTKKEVTGSGKKAFDKGMEAYRAGKNQDAIDHFSKALKSVDNFIDAEIQRAAAYYDLKDFVNAEIGFEKVRNLNPAYKTMVLYTLGKTEMALHKFSEAITHFQEYQDIEKKNVKLLERARGYQQDCVFMNDALNNKVPFEPVKLSANINTDMPEYLPALTADGGTMIYTRKVRGQEDFYISKNVDGEWRLGRALEDVNTPANEGAQSISADGKFLVFTSCGRPDGIGSCDLYYSEVIDGRWTKAKNIGGPINTKAWESQPSISADGRTLFFSSNRGGGLGEKDIWYSLRGADGKWSAPKNCGDRINTIGSDQSPFIHPDGETLYFMSDGWPGMGAHDLFYSRKDDSLSWSTPTNLGFPINTQASEGALVISLDGSTAYFASDRENINKEISVFDDVLRGGDTDIYSFQLYEAARPKPVTYVRAKVTDSKKKKPLKAKVEFVNLSTGEVHSSSTTDIDGEFLVCLPLGNNYALNVNKEEYLFHSENFSLTDKNLGKPYFLDITLQKIPPGLAANSKPAVTPPPAPKPIILKNVFFDSGSARLRPESSTELDRLKMLLTDNPKMAIEISGHTDNTGGLEANISLSENRAFAVYDYLVKNGIASNRLTYKGYGETKPIDVNTTEAGRQNNRRTEFVIKQ